MTRAEAPAAPWARRLQALPPEASPPPASSSSVETVVVLDDDPTGTQAVSGVPVLTAWEVEDLRWALATRASAVFVSLNTRSLAPAAARSRVVEATRAAIAAARLERRPVVFASRSDSTLRGHFPLETDAIGEGLTSMGRPFPDGVVVIPAFIESGRVTVDGVHLVLRGGDAIPVGATEFAADATFGYRSSDLREWIEEKTEGRWRAADIVHVSIDAIRTGGATLVGSILARLEDGQPVVVDAVSNPDLAVVAAGVRVAEAAGRTFVYRVGPSFVRARANLPAAERVDRAAVSDVAARLGAAGAGLVVAGSHVEVTQAQLDVLRGLPGLSFVELEVAAVVDEVRRAGEVETKARAATAALARGDVVVHTSSERATGSTPGASLELARVVADSLCDLARRVLTTRRPGWVVGKGGITSSDLARRGLGLRRAWVRGSLLPDGVSLWEPELADVPVPFAVFPGNVGASDGLRRVVELLRSSG
ncbi:MAG: four-carbon acid sugar kinase family protein [Gaiellales bacterium]